MDAEICALREKLLDKERELHEKERNLDLAKTLAEEQLETNDELSRKIQVMAEEDAKKLEAMMQENHSLKMKLEGKILMEAEYQQEIDILRKEQQDGKKVAQMEQQHEAEISALKNQVRTLQDENERHELCEKQLHDTKQQLEKNLQQIQKELEENQNKLNETCSEELSKLYQEIDSQKAELMTLSRELSETSQLNERLSHELKQRQSEVEAKDAEIEEKNCHMTTYINALEKCRGEVQELKVQLDLVRLENQDKKKKGNSLFAEVEDRRVAAEKKMITMTSELHSAKEELKLTKSNLHRIKMQMAGLMQMGRGRADQNAVQNLRDQLDKVLSENMNLQAKLDLAEQDVQFKVNKIEDLMSKRMEGNADKNYVEFLQEMIKAKEKEIEELQGSVRRERWTRLDEQEKVMRSERSRYSLERDTERQRGLILKLTVQLDELQLKYEPDKVKKPLTQAYRVEKLPELPTKTDSETSEKKTEDQEEEEGKENKMAAVGRATGSAHAHKSGFSRFYHWPLNWDEDNMQKTESERRVKFSEESAECEKVTAKTNDSGHAHKVSTDRKRKPKASSTFSSVPYPETSADCKTQ